MKLASKWDPSKNYDKLSIVEFDNILYISTKSNNKGILPPPLIVTDFVDNSDYIEELCKLMPTVSPNKDNSWLRI